jgi:hypothetical protein
MLYDFFDGSIIASVVILVSSVLLCVPLITLMDFLVDLLLCSLVMGNSNQR